MTIYDDLFEAQEGTITIKVTPRRVHAMLRFFHPNLDPEDLTALFGVEPDFAKKKGDQRLGKKGRVYSPYSKGVWLLDSESHVKSLDVNFHIQWLLDEVAHCNGAIRKLQDDGYSIDVMCGWFADCDNTCPSLSAEIIRRLATFRLSCWFDVYL